MVLLGCRGGTSNRLLENVLLELTLKEELAGQMWGGTFHSKGIAKRGGERGSLRSSACSVTRSSDVTHDAGKVDTSLRLVLRNWNLFWR